MTANTDEDHIDDMSTAMLAKSAAWYQDRAARDFAIGQTAVMPDDLASRATWQKYAADASAKAMRRLFALIERNAG